MAEGNGGSAVDWRDGHKSLAEQLWYFYQYEIETDLEVCIVHRQSQRLYRCHKVVFMRLSAKLQTMINDYDKVEGEMCVIGLSAVTPATFEKVLKFAYTDQLDKFESFNEAQELKQFSESYGIKSLLFHCDLFLAKLEIDEDTIWGLMESADRSKNINTKIKKFIGCNTIKFLKADKFLSCSQSVLLEVLSMDMLTVNTELQLVHAALRWAKAKNEGAQLDPETSRRLLGPCLEQLRFLALTPAEFSGHVATSGLFSSEDSLKILVRLTSKQPTEIPEGVSTITTPRTVPPAAAQAAKKVKSEPQAPKPSTSKAVPPTQQVKVANKGSMPKKLILCYRDITPGLEVLQTELITPKKFTVTEFSVDKRANIHGLQLVTPTKPQNSKASLHKEYLHLFVRHKWGSNQPVAFHTFITEVQFDSVVDIMFSKPSELKPGVTYAVELTMKSQGAYICSSRSSVVLTSGMQICFTRDNDNFPFSGLLQALHISK